MSFEIEVVDDGTSLMKASTSQENFPKNSNWHFYANHHWTEITDVTCITCDDKKKSVACFAKLCSSLTHIFAIKLSHFIVNTFNEIVTNTQA